MNRDWRDQTLNDYAWKTYSKVRVRAAEGRRKHGERFVGDPLDHAEEEALDLLYYINFAKRQRESSQRESTNTLGLYTLGFNTFAYKCYQQAKANGWHDEPRSFGDEIALIHSEVSEALEEYRKTGDPTSPEVVEEMADIVIRLADLVGKHGIDLQQAIRDKMEKNAKRPYRHGGKHL